MRRRLLILILTINGSLCGLSVQAAILRVQDLNAPQLRGLDRATTVVLLTGGILEEHGPYLPASTDAVLSDRLTREIAQSVLAKKPGWTVLLFPQIPLGASGSNEVGGLYTFPGTYAVRPSTLRSIFMDLATELGDQGFRHLLVIHIHGSPLHLRAIDDAGDFFRDTYGGWMVNVWDLVPVISAWGQAMMSTMTAAEQHEDGASLHGGADEHSLLLYLRPELVAPGYRTAPVVTGRTTPERFEVARGKEWPGYLGSPHLATARLGEKIWKAFVAAANDQVLRILDGADPSSTPRYVDLLEKNPTYQERWIQPSRAHDAAVEEKQRAWLARARR
jgi:creatinine amidohydrolase